MVTVESTFTKDNLLRDLVPDNPLILYGVSWETYENLVRELDGSSVQITYNRGILKLMSKSGEHEYYIEFLKQLVGILSRIILKKVIHFGGPTIKKSFAKKGVEPDACFYVSRANLVSGRADVNVSEIVPDIVVEVDVTHADEDKFEIYSAFGISEFWRYNENNFQIFRLENNEYKEISESVELPQLSAKLLTEYLNRSKSQDQFDLLIEFENELRKK
ncbi:MAG: Uma2 family endonuclease [Pyrinomonadaceae bacterium]|jgi:Uma2 family endonuclease|nr:Uma2 family endonuclease [Pyrinomonadaceae bacterium]